MLVEFRVANFRSFREEQVFSLVASKDEKLPGNLIPTPHFNLLKSAAIYGANASGKSNLIKAMQFFHRFVLTSATTMNQGDPIVGISPFRLDEKSRTQPSAFEITLAVDKSVYRYGFTATPERVHDEWLVVTPQGGRKQGWFERRYNPETDATLWSFRGPLQKDEVLLKERTRDNGLVLSRGAEQNVKPLAALFLSFWSRLSLFDLSQDSSPLIATTIRLMEDSPESAAQIERMVRDADLGIRDINIVRQPCLSGQLPGNESVPQRSRRAPSTIASILEEHLFGIRTPKTLHHTADSDRMEQFDLEEDESNGTIRFFALAGPVLNALQDGSTIVVDEIDCSMHPLLTRQLIELFQSPEANKSGAQLVFTTQDSSLMDLDLFRRDQIWITEKNHSFATELYSLYDFEERPRNTEAVERNYLAGRYGGVPRFGATFEDLVLR